MAWQRHSAYPLSQVANASLALFLWLIIGTLSKTDAREVAISSYALGVPASLMATLGIAFVLPNTFRATALTERNGPGPWSKPLWIAVAASAIFCAAGTALCIVPGPTHKLLAGTTMTMAAFIAVGTAVAQVGRTVGQLWLTLAGQLAVPTTAFIWLISIYLFETDTSRIRVAGFLMTGGWALLALTLAPFLGKYHATAAAWQPLIVASATLLPHLLMFGVLLQGVRILAVLAAKPPEFVQTAHVLMLAVSGGLTLLASINSYIAPYLQSASEATYRKKLHASLRIYTSAAIAVVMGVWLAIWAFTKASLLADTSGATYFYVAIALLSVAAYYSMSAQWMRHLNTTPLIVASTCSAATLTIPTLIGAQLSLDGMVCNFAIAALVLSAIMSFIGVLLRDCEIRFWTWLPVALGIFLVLTFFFVS